MMMKLKCKRFCRGSFKHGHGGNKVHHDHPIINNGEIKWEVRPGGMLVQKRESGDSSLEFITITVSTLSLFHHISIQPTSTFGELKMVLSMVTGLEPREQRVFYKGKERDDNEYLHMVGIKDKDKVLLLEDPAIKETKLHATPPCPKNNCLIHIHVRSDRQFRSINIRFEPCRFLSEITLSILTTFSSWI